MPLKDPRSRDPVHLAFVRRQPCLVCRSRWEIEAAHVRMACLEIGKRSTGMQEKPHDKWTVPLCAYHHRTGPRGVCQHGMSERAFWAKFDIDPFQVAARLWRSSGGATREAAAQMTPSDLKAPPGFLGPALRE